VLPSRVRWGRWRRTLKVSFMEVVSRDERTLRAHLMECGVLPFAGIGKRQNNSHTHENSELMR